MTDAEPVPCWFCRSTRVTLWRAPYAQVRCGNCFARGPEADTNEGALVAWSAPAHRLPYSEGVANRG